MSLINCNVELSLKWVENCVLTTAKIGANVNATGGDSAILEVTDVKLYVPVVPLSAEDNVNLVKHSDNTYFQRAYIKLISVIIRFNLL